MIDEKQKVISACIEKMYRMEMRKVPDELNYVAKQAVKDFFAYSPDEIRKMFAYAFRIHEGTKPPTTREVLKYWGAGHKDKVNTIGCQSCRNGYISALNEIDGRWLNFLCKCALGAEIGHGMDKKVMVWAKQKGFISESDWKKR